MKMKMLGCSKLEVSELCLGSMTWGSQNSAEDAHEQIDRAMDAGINFIDTAEMYPVNPIKERTIGRTERIVGLWFERDMRREEVILATKHSGEGFVMVRRGNRYPPKRSALRLKGPCAASKRITSTCTSFTGQTVAAICSARTGHMIHQGKTVRKRLPTW